MSAATDQATRPGRRAGSASLAALLVLGLLLLGLVVPAAASADTRPDAGVPATFAADALGTVQVNGVVWAMTTVGNTVYATGSFTQARPAGAAAGTNQTPRANLVAFNLTTGVMTTFSHTLNGQGRAITASPDGTRIYVGGDFTTVDGVARSHVAAFTVSTGALITTFAPTVSGAVYSLAATDSTVYVGGNFTVAGGQSRSRLAAFSSTGTLSTTWAPTADHIVRGIVLSPDGTRVIVAGQFATVNGMQAVALASVNLSGGDTRTWNTGFTNAGDAGGAYSLRTDGTNLYVTMYGFQVGNVEGTVAVDPSTLALVWMNDCHGDPYDTFITNGVVYTAGHVHDCETSGNYPNQTPTVWKRVVANTTTARCSLKATTQTPRYTSWTGRPCPALLTFYPTLAAGSVTGQAQAAWSLTGNSNYMVLGGEFPTVNGAAQQGLVRVATTAIAPNRRGPELTAAQMRPSATSAANGQVTVTWPSSWDMDNQNLTYNLYRTGTAAPIYTATIKSDWWNRQNLRYTDTLAAGSTASYQVRVADPIGNTVTSSTSNTVTVASGSSAYANQVLADGALQYWRLGETSGTTAVDYASNYAMTEGAGITRGVAGAVSGDAAVTGSGGSTGIAVTSQTVGQVPQTPPALSVEAWVKTTSAAGGVIAQYGNSASGANTVSDRTLYIDSGGRLSYGMSRQQGGTNGRPLTFTYTTVRSTTAINDGQWHHVVGTTGASGSVLYVDGAQVGSDATMTRLNTQFTGYWMVGGGTLSAWPNAPTSSFLNGSIDEVAVYGPALTPAQVANHRSLATGTATNASPTAAFTPTVAGLQVSADATASTDSDGTIASYAWNWGDGSTTPASTTKTASHTYTTAGPYTITLTVADNGGATGTTTRTVTVTDPSNTPPTASFTATPSGLQVSVDGSASSDAQGPIAGYTWNWGDTTANGTGVTATHTYSTGGTYTITLTVRDSANASGTATRQVTVTAPAGPAVAQDTFGRTVAAGGWGSADTGGAWAAGAGGPRLSVTPGAGILDLPAAGNNTAAYLGGVSQPSADVSVSFTLSSAPTGLGTDVYVTPRRMANADDIRVRARVAPGGQVTLSYSRRIAGTEGFGSSVTVAGLTWTSGTTLTVRVQTSTTTAGTTTRARVWAGGQTEPTAWQLNQAVDTSASLQGPGSVGVGAYRGTSSTAATSVRVSSFVARPVA